MAKILICAGCSAPLDLPSGAMARCPYCGSTTMLSDESHRKSEPNRMMSPPAAFTPKEDRPSWMTAAVAAAVMSILAVLGVIIGLSTKRQTVSDERIAVVQNTPAPTPEFAVRVLEFGDKGMGPGQFQDPRTVAVD